MINVETFIFQGKESELIEKCRSRFVDRGWVVIVSRKNHMFLDEFCPK